jgi:hypothetical protein
LVAMKVYLKVVPKAEMKDEKLDMKKAAMMAE